MTKHEAFKEWLKERHACRPAYRWVCQNKATLRKAWRQAPYPQWIVWLYGQLTEDWVGELFDFSADWFIQLELIFGDAGDLAYCGRYSNWHDRRTVIRDYQRKNWKLPKVPKGL